MKARSRWEQDSVLTRTLGAVGRLSGGPEERPSEDSIHTQMDSRGGFCSSNQELQFPTRPSRGATRHPVC